eukprot:7043901-Alexandrium_andersonii.AAC.1
MLKLLARRCTAPGSAKETRLLAGLRPLLARSDSQSDDLAEPPVLSPPMELMLGRSGMNRGRGLASLQLRALWSQFREPYNASPAVVVVGFLPHIACVYLVQRCMRVCCAVAPASVTSMLSTLLHASRLSELNSWWKGSEAANKWLGSTPPSLHPSILPSLQNS